MKNVNNIEINKDVAEKILANTNVDYFLKVKEENKNIRDYLSSEEFREIKKMYQVKKVQKDIDSKNYVFHKVLIDTDGTIQVIIK